MVVQEYRKVLKLQRGCLYVLVPGILYPHLKHMALKCHAPSKAISNAWISGYLFAVWSSLSTCWGIPHWAWQPLPNPLLQHGSNLSSREATQPQVSALPLILSSTPGPSLFMPPLLEKQDPATLVLPALIWVLTEGCISGCC